MRRAATLLAALLAVAGPARAHDFWLQPASFRLAPGAATALTLQVGEGASRRRSPIPARRIVRFEAVGPDGRRLDLRGDLRLGGATSDAELRFAGPGGYVVALETDNRAVSRQPAERFNAYLRDEGLTPALEARRRSGRAGADGSERYGRVAKTLVRVGPADTGAAAALATPLGLPLEIVLEQAPDALPRPATLTARVYHQGRPLGGALVKLAELGRDAGPVAGRRSDGSGRVSFATPGAGAWRLSVVWTRPLPRRAETEFETVFSSLTFAVPETVAEAR